MKKPGSKPGEKIFKKEMKDHGMKPEQFKKHVMTNQDAYSKPLINFVRSGESGMLLYEGGGKNWIAKAVNPKHKGYCTPMTKATCTPRRKALARRFKAMAKHEQGGQIKMYNAGGLTPGTDQMSVADSTKVHQLIDPNYDYKAYTPGFATLPAKEFGSNSETNPYKEALLWGGIGLLYLVNPALGAVATTMKLGYDAAGNTFKDRDTGEWNFNNPHSWTTEETVDFGVNAGLSMIAPGVGGVAEKMVAGRVAKGGFKPLVNAIEKSSVKIPYTKIPIIPASESLNTARNFANANKAMGAAVTGAADTVAGNAIKTTTTKFSSPSIMENFWRNYTKHGVGVSGSLLGPGVAAGTIAASNKNRNPQPKSTYQSIDKR